MIYNEFQGKKLSSLGLGCMRFPTVPDTEGVVDEAAVEKMIAYALEQGINYFDTAWVYHSGNSENILGRILTKYPRESYYLATKMPSFAPEHFRDHKEIFFKQLEKCQTDYFDFYLFHNVAEKNIENFTNDKIGIFDFLVEQKRAGKIKHLGFSTHGSLATMRRFLEKYGHELEFCQIQLNYLDWQLQNAKAKVDLITEFGLPVWVMEPVRGGKLATLNEEEMAMLNALRPGATAPEWAFRFLQSIPAVTMVLSGMSNDQQLQENIATFSENKPLNAQEMEALMGIADGMIRKNAVPCTACSYCTDGCPMNLPIPELIKQYNEKTAPGTAGPENCIACRKCESVCPQGIKISQVMADFAERLK